MSAPTEHVAKAAEKGVELTAKVPVAPGVPAAIAGKLAFSAAQSVAESLTEPFLTYQTAFRDKRDELKAQGAAVVVKHCHRHGLGEAFPEVTDIALDVVMGMIADSITAQVCDLLPKKDPAFVVLPRMAIEETVAFIAGEAVPPGVPRPPFRICSWDRVVDGPSARCRGQKILKRSRGPRAARPRDGLWFTRSLTVGGHVTDCGL